ncbi:hypothetical protein [Solimicrobium silvestre]|uniref:DUF2946 domain-containing protein n=1 Tax=Solimicrobium silvestre TaxID=2099400 RepID=A0A2S9H5C9_9BURK|nr:hypothetical protein [Solimicrobium silvestre]PRC95076.1 hypothetical protein S2091_0271 [Solimicrobium silvestre]
MKRILIIFLLTILPLQMSWASVANYCLHEQDKSVQHFGHHTHQHQTEQQPQSDGTDSDCDYCHHTGSIFALTNSLQLTDAAHPFPLALDPVLYQSHIPDSLTKPNWRGIN